MASKKYIIKKLGFLLFAAFSVLYILPLIITFTNSFMSESEILENYSTAPNMFNLDMHFINMYLIPFLATWSQYKTILFQTPTYLTAFWNSAAIALPVVAGQMIVSAMGAYAFTVLRFKWKEGLFFVYILVMLLPLQVTLMPNYIVADALHMTDSYWAIILPGIFNPFGVFIIRQYMESIPKAYIESASMDGAGHFSIFTKIVLPNAKPGLAAVSILTFIDYWNVIDQGVVFIKDTYRQPLSLFIAGINNRQMGVAFSSSCFYVFPVLVIIFYCQDYLKEGIQMSGVKG